MKKTVLSIFCLLLCVFAHTQSLRLAVAANAQFVIKKLQADFKKRTGIETEAVTGSSGNLSTQIKNGAPFDVFLSADMDFPTSLYKDGFAVAEPAAYALGSLIVCSTSIPDLKNWRSLLLQPSVQKIAVANPALAPYGKAAEQALRTYDLWNKANPRFVMGESISQVNTFVTTGAASLGFTTEALVYEYAGQAKLKWVRVDPKVYDPIRQGFVVLSYAKKGNYDKAMQFSEYIASPAARQILKQYGYRIP